jgi:hypothetical protein
MTTIEDIKQQLREIIELSNKATPAPWICVNPPLVKGCPQDEHDENLVTASRNLTPKMTKVLLRVIDDLEKDQALDGHIIRHRATLRLETIRREWEVQV